MQNKWQPLILANGWVRMTGPRCDGLSHYFDENISLCGQYLWFNHLGRAANQELPACARCVVLRYLAYSV